MVLISTPWIRHVAIARCGCMVAAAVGVAVAVFLSSPQTAMAQRTCLPQGGPGTTYLCDPLESTATAAADVVGGTFLADGWRVDSYFDRVLFDLGQPMLSGTLRFYFRGVSEATLHEVGTGTAVHRHLMEIWDDGGPVGIGGAAYAMKIRTWGDSSTEEPGLFGRLRFSMTSFPEAMVLNCGEENYFANERVASSWTGGWIRTDIQFGAGVAEITLTEESTQLSWTRSVTYDNCAPGTPVLRYLYLPLQPPPNSTSIADSVRNSVYAWVSFVGTPANCYDPCDDGNPCTEGLYGDAQFTHYCEVDQCTADPVQDGTPCNGSYICIGGVCSDEIQPDAGVDTSDGGSPDSGSWDGSIGSEAAVSLDGASGAHGSNTTGGCSCRAQTRDSDSRWPLFFMAIMSTLFWSRPTRRRSSVKPID